MSIIPEIETYPVGDVVYEEQGEFGPRVQPFLQLVFIYNGEVCVSGAGFLHVRHGGEAFFLIPGVTYRISFDANERVRHGWVDIPTVYTPPAWLAMPGQEATALPFTDRMRTLAQLANDVPLDKAESGSQLRHAIGRAIVEEAFLSAGIHESPGDHLPPAVLRAESFMLRQFHRTLTLDEVARDVGVSKAHLIRLFREHTHTTPARRLWAIRVGAGSRLLRETGLQVQEIADRCGFPSPYHFSRLIKQAHGESPRNYRQRHWQAGEVGSGLSN